MMCSPFQAMSMFAGIINGQLVLSCHPILVAGPGGVAAGFGSLDAARRFLAGRGLRAGFIYRHNGRDWDKVECDVDPASAAGTREGE